MCGSAPRFLGARAPARMNDDSCLRRNMPEQFQQVVPPQRDTARGRRKSVPGDMDEHGAAAPGHARPRVVVDFDDQIVEAVVPAKPIAWFIGRPPERHGYSGGPRGPRTRRRRARSAAPAARSAAAAGDRPATTAGPGETGRPVCRRRLRACRRLDPAAAERNSEACNVAGEQPALRAPARPGVDADEAK